MVLGCGGEGRFESGLAASLYCLSGSIKTILRTKKDHMEAQGFCSVVGLLP